MKLLIDTHIFLWVLAEPNKLSRDAKALMTDPANLIISSAAVVWEIAIKHARNQGRAGDMPISGDQAIMLAEAAGIDFVDITPDHCARAGKLAMHHRDPFDRLLVAQAVCEGLTLLTHDKELAAYGDFVITV